MRTGRSALVAVALLVVAGGCGSPAPAPAPAPVAAPAPATTAAPPPNADAAACTAQVATSNAVRSIVAVADKGPVLPAAIALFLLDARNKAAMPMTDPALAKAQTELVAAVDDLDAQGKAALPPGGNPAQNAVRLDTARITAADAAVDKACAALK